MEIQPMDVNNQMKKNCFTHINFSKFQITNHVILNGSATASQLSGEQATWLEMTHYNFSGFCDMRLWDQEGCGTFWAKTEMRDRCCETGECWGSAGFRKTEKLEGVMKNGTTGRPWWLSYGCLCPDPATPSHARMDLSPCLSAWGRGTAAGGTCRLYIQKRNQEVALNEASVIARDQWHEVVLKSCDKHCSHPQLHQHLQLQILSAVTVEAYMSFKSTYWPMWDGAIDQHWTQSVSDFIPFPMSI